MASDLPLKTTFTWGDGVIVLMNAPEIYRPGAEGYICGMRVVDTDKLKKSVTIQVIPFTAQKG